MNLERYIWTDKKTHKKQYNIITYKACGMCSKTMGTTFIVCQKVGSDVIEVFESKYWHENFEVQIY